MHPHTTSEWDFFGSSELRALAQKALSDSFDVKIIEARQRQAEAVLKKADASLFPTLNYSAGGQRKATQVKKNSNSASNYDGSHSWDVSATGAWTPDIWGKEAAGSRAREISAAAAGQDLEGARQNLVRQMAEHWIDIIATRNRLKVLNRQIQVNEAQLELQKLRYANGRANALDVSQQTEAVAQIRAQKPLLERREATLLSAVGLLSGNVAPEADMITTAHLPETDAVPSAGLPADLLAARPDIRAGQLRLEALHWDVKGARADFLPSLTLTARALFSSGSLDLLFNNWVATLTAALTGPLFDGGLHKAEIERLEAMVKEQSAAYAGLVAKAMVEVEDLLVTIATQDDYIRLLLQEQEIAGLTLKDARIQYLNGKSSYLTYLIILNRTEQIERQIVEEKASALKYRVRLHRALGFKGVDSPNRSGVTE